jgi:hypothetical protein
MLVVSDYRDKLNQNQERKIKPCRDKRNRGETEGIKPNHHPIARTLNVTVYGSQNHKNNAR